MNIIIQKWVEALRSGRYKQARQALSTEGGFCCLGVACDLFAPDNERSLKQASRLDGQTVVTWFDQDGYLPSEIQKLLGCNRDGSFTETRYIKINGLDQSISSLALANDLGASFEQIADLIESNPEGLFSFS